MIKKLSFFFLAVIVLLALAACNSTDNPAASVTNEMRETIASSSPSPSPSPTTKPISTDWRQHVLKWSSEAFSQEESLPDAPVFGLSEPRKSIVSISFLDDFTHTPDDARDISSANDGSILAWTESSAGGTELLIAAPGGIAAPEDCTALFMGYSSLETINYNASFHTENTNSFEKMFAGCSSLKSVNLAELATESVTSMKEMFAGCSSLTEINLKGTNTSSLTDIRGMFLGCESLEEIDLSEFDTANVSNMSNLFEGCSNLSIVDMSATRIKDSVVCTDVFKGCPLMMGYADYSPSVDLSTKSRTIYQDHVYQLFNEELSWEEARAFCEKMGGHLVTISNAEENVFVSSLASTSSKDYIRIGAYRRYASQFIWCNGEHFTYANWASGEPNNSGGRENYGVIRKPSDSDGQGYWNDIGSAVAKAKCAFICEWESKEDIHTPIKDIVAQIPEDLVTDLYMEEVDFSYDGWDTNTGTTREMRASDKLKIPVINLASEDVKRINQELYDYYHPYLMDSVSELHGERHGGPKATEIDYSYNVCGNILSLRTWLVLNAIQLEKTYQVIIPDGIEVKTDDLFKLIGLSGNAAIDRTREATGALINSTTRILGVYSYDEDEFYNHWWVEIMNEHRTRTLSEDYLSQSRYFLNEDGQLCCSARISCEAGTGWTWYVLNLESFEIYPDYDLPIQVKSHSINYSQEEAIEIAKEYWGGNALVRTYGTVNGPQNKTYYQFFAMAQMGETLATVDMCYVDSETGAVLTSID